MIWQLPADKIMSGTSRANLYAKLAQQTGRKLKLTYVDAQAHDEVFLRSVTGTLDSVGCRYARMNGGVFCLDVIRRVEFA